MSTAELEIPDDISQRAADLVDVGHLRRMFAAHALAGILAHDGGTDDRSAVIEATRRAYRYADEMLRTGGF